MSDTAERARMSDIKPIRTEADYGAALAKIERLWGAPAGTPEGDRLDVLATLVDVYESERYPMDPPDPIEAIRFRMEQQGLTRRDLEALIGTRTWVAVNTTRSGVEVVDIRGGSPTFVRKVPASVTGSAHDTSFSADGRSMYAASPGTGTYVVDVTSALTRDPTQIAFTPQDSEEPKGAGDPYNLTTSHQADTSADGKVLVFTDERGGVLSNTACNTDPNGVIGGMHFWALAPVDGQAQTASASPSNPVRLGTWFHPNPLLAVDALDPVLASIGRTERACTVHVFRNGGNGTAGPGAIVGGFDVYAFARCEGLGCVVKPQNTPGKASGNVQVE